MAKRLPLDLAATARLDRRDLGSVTAGIATTRPTEFTIRGIVNNCWTRAQIRELINTTDTRLKFFEPSPTLPTLTVDLVQTE